MRIITATSGRITARKRWKACSPIVVSRCHVGGGAPQGLRLDEAISYALLVGVASMEVPSILRVAPGDPMNSYIIQKEAQRDHRPAHLADLPLSRESRAATKDGA